MRKMAAKPLVIARRGSTGLAISFALLLLAGCDRNRGQPPRANDAIVIEPQPSILAVPVEAELGNLARLIEGEVPAQLWRIDKPGQTCVASKRVDLGIATVKTPTIKCRIVGSVTRGRVALAGKGEDIEITIPLRAVVSAVDVGGVLKRETATADAIVTARMRITFARDWTPRATMRIAYDWTDTPHIEFLGQRIDFTAQAERQLAPILARLERNLPAELGKMGLRDAIAGAWTAAFTTISLNRENPAAWMRIAPRELRYGGYTIADGRLRLNLGLRAITETHIGNRPPPPEPTPLPPMQPVATPVGRLAFFIPVIADYRVLEPVLMKALRRRSARPFDIPGLDPVRARFEKVEIYGTTNGRIAVGLTFTALEAGDTKPTHGTVWMTGKPVTRPDSRAIGFEDFAVSGTTDMTGGDLILDLVNAPGVAPMIAGLLAQNFERDYAKLIGKVDRAIANQRQDRVIIRADLERTRTGQLQAAGQGLYLPVWAEGTASITVTP
ncbi:DUF4403 family protein [Sphingomonas sp. S1-29]|uniref:DUF4403 family protein n=1 Tax=Sphingomonas sp. S1-29 TaxID=2991074 RepID=UPI002AD5B184|nr:DUF4403 family protein [Sphingomonas sp. S1-29]